jgi:hypothetical protein
LLIWRTFFCYIIVRTLADKSIKIDRRETALT